MASAKNSNGAGPLGGQPRAVETGNSKLEVRDAPIGNRKSAIYTPAKVRENGRKKKIYARSH
jgi:hypothetical protein